jgi:anhydro-N-acetylmuramic acid kinase
MIQTGNRGIGLMCGTSHDGIDICDVSFDVFDSEWSFKVHEYYSVSLSHDLKEKLSKATNMSAIEYVALDNLFANFTAKNVIDFVEKTNSKASFIASHGVTIFHQPEKGISTQIGSGAIISALTGLKTISDFRLQDVSKGGQGAPLVPYADSQLFKKYDSTLNLGGFANISRLKGALEGYDIGVCNLMLNHLSKKSGKAYDEDGNMARSGKIIPELFEQLNNHKYFDISGPKSLGKEWFDAFVLPMIQQFDFHPTEDLLATSVEHVAYQIGKSLSKENESCLVTGGGAHNKYLTERIKHYSNTQIELPNEAIIDFKESICFAFLGYLRLLELHNISHKVTGAKQNSSAGAVYLP